MYMSKKPHQTPSPPPPPPPPQPLLEAPPLNYYSKEEEDDEDEVNHHDSDMIIEVSTTHLPPHLHHQHLHLGGDTSTSGGEENIINPCSSNLKAPKKRAETWVPEETRSLINLRRETDSLFSTSKSNKHLWDEISIKMREKGFDRSPNMCTDKWRNLLKEFKKAKQNQDPNGCPKMSYYKDIDEILKGRSKSGDTNDSPSASKVDSFMQFSNKERRVDPISTCPINAVATGGVSPWNWRETPGNGEQNTSFEGRVITIKWEGYTKRIGIDGTSEAIKETIKAAFRLRTKRVFWLEDEDNIIRTLDRDMPLGNYTLHIDEGLMIKVCLYEESDNLAVHTEDKIFYTEEDFKDFLSRRGWTCLREYNGFRNIYCMDELCHGGIYRGTT